MKKPYFVHIISIAVFILVSITVSKANGEPIKRVEYPNPILWYTFDETEGDTVHNHSGENFFAIIDESTQIVAGQFIHTGVGSGLTIDSYTSLSGIGEISLAFRISIRNLEKYATMTIIESEIDFYNKNYKIGYRPNDNEEDPHFSIYRDSSDYKHIPYTIQDTAYHDLVVVYEDTLAAIYFEGILLEENIKVAARNATFKSLYIGRNLTGAFDEVKIYNAALNSHQVKTVFEADTISPTIPNNFTSKLITNNQVQLNWGASFDSNGVAGYEIFRDTTLILTTDNYTYTDTGLAEGVTYVYTIRAFDYSGNYSEFAITNIQTQLYTLSGIVMVGKNNLNMGVVYLYKVDTSNVAIIIDSSNVSSGNYYFQNIYRGEYKVKAVPIGEASNQYYERYYENGKNLEEATVLYIDSDFSHVIINLVPLVLDIGNNVSLSTYIYPTLVKNELNIVNKEGYKREIEVVITNLLGVQMLSGKIGFNEIDTRIDLSSVPSGIYIVYLISQNKMFKSHKIIVM